MTCGIYKITNTKNEKYYIGSSKNIEKRWKEHISELNNNKHGNRFLQEDWNKYGKNSFKFEVIEVTKQDDRYNVEQSYLDELKPFYYSNGYNISESSTTRNTSNLRIFRNKFYRLNPFYRASKNDIKRMLKDERYREYSEDNVNTKIDTEHRYEWYYLDGAYCMVKPHKRRPIEVDIDFVDNHTSDEVLDYYDALETYREIAEMMVESGECADEWY